MKILICSPVFLDDKYPISHILRGLVNGLHADGCDVTVLTISHPRANAKQYPHRIKTVNRLGYQSNSIYMKLIQSLYYSARFLFAAFFIAGIDVIYVPVPPNIIAIAMGLLGRIKNIRIVINVQDIHPDVIIALSKRKNYLLHTFLEVCEMLMLKLSTGLVVICENFKQNYLKKGFGKPIAVIPNWVDLDFYASSVGSSELRNLWDINENQFVVLYAGTLGRIHGTRVILEVAKRSINPNILFLFVGHGADFNSAIEYVEKNNLNNVIIKPSIEYNVVPGLQSISSLSIVAMLPNLSVTSLPSKGLAYMAASKPVLCISSKESDLAKVIDKYDCGYVVESYDPNVILGVINKAYSLRSELEVKGSHSRRAAELCFGIKAYINSHRSFLLELAE